MAIAASKITVLLVDDHPLVREGLRTVLEGEPDLRLVGEAGSGTDALAFLEAAELPPQVILLDLNLPDADGVQMVARIRTASPESHIIVLTIYDSEGYLMAALQEGVAGYLLKDQPQTVIPLAIRAVVAGGYMYPRHILQRVAQAWAGGRSGAAVALSPRELAILQLVAQGYGNKQVAAHLKLAESTVKKYVQNMIAKLGASDRGHAAVLGMRMGLLN